MNTNTKILNKILTNQIQQHIKKTSHQDQVGFILGVQGWVEIQKLINLIHQLDRMKGKNHKTISPEAGKGFNKMNYNKKALNKLDVGKFILRDTKGHSQYHIEQGKAKILFSKNWNNYSYSTHGLRSSSFFCFLRLID